MKLYIEYKKIVGLATIEDLREQLEELHTHYMEKTQKMKNDCDEKKKTADNEYQQLIASIRGEAEHSIAQRTGKPLERADIDRLVDALAKKEAAVIQMRLDNIKMKNKFKKQEDALRSKVNTPIFTFSTFILISLHFMINWFPSLGIH